MDAEKKAGGGKALRLALQEAADAYNACLDEVIERGLCHEPRFMCQRCDRIDAGDPCRKKVDGRMRLVCLLCKQRLEEDARQRRRSSSSTYQVRMGDTVATFERALL